MSKQQVTRLDLTTEQVKAVMLATVNARKQKPNPKAVLMHMYFNDTDTTALIDLHVKSDGPVIMGNKTCDLGEMGRRLYEYGAKMGAKNPLAQFVGVIPPYLLGVHVRNAMQARGIAFDRHTGKRIGLNNLAVMPPEAFRQQQASDE